MAREFGTESGVAGGRSLIRRERMRGQFTIEIEGLEEVYKFFEGFPNEVMKETAGRMLRATIILQREIMRNVTKRFKQRTGQFRKSWYLQMLTKSRGGPSQLTGSSIVGIVGSNHPAAWIQDVGGVISAKGAAMPVPLTEEAKRKRIQGFNRPLFVSPGGFLSEAVGGGILQQFVLAKRVTIQGTNYLHEAIQKAEPAIVNEVGDGVGIVIARGAK